MISRLVVNGCSYMHAYATGGGHRDLAARCGISQAESLAVSGCANSRILRSTLKHSFAAAEPTLYVLGMTFLSRDELPILDSDDPIEGRWTNPQNQDVQHLWQHSWTAKDTSLYVKLKLKWEFVSVIDRMEDLQYQICAVAESLRSRAHRVMIFNQADDTISQALMDDRLALLRDYPAVVHGYQWQAVQWQHQQGVPSMHYGSQVQHVVPDHLKHREYGCHSVVNQFLADYLRDHALLS